MASIIRNLRLNRIDLVDAPANPRSHVVLVKRDALVKRIRESGGKYEVTTEDGSRVLGTHPTRGEAERQLAAIEAQKHKKNAGPSLASVHVNTPSRRKVVKRQEIVKFAKGLMALVKGEPVDPDTTELEKQSAELEKSIAVFGDVSKLAADHPVHGLIAMKKSMDGQIEAAAADMNDDDEDDDKKEAEKRTMKAVEKRATEIAKAETASLRAEVAAATARAAAAETLAKAHQEASDVAGVTAELKKFDCLTLDLAVQVPLFKALKASSPDVYKSTIESLAAANEVAKAGRALETSINTSRGGGTGPTAWQEIEKLAGEMIAKSGADAPTKAKAIELVMEQRKDLVKRYYEEEDQVIA